MDKGKRCDWCGKPTLKEKEQFFTRREGKLLELCENCYVNGVKLETKPKHNDKR